MKLLRKIYGGYLIADHELGLTTKFGVDAYLSVTVGKIILPYHS